MLEYRHMQIEDKHRADTDRPSATLTDRQTNVSQCTRQVQHSMQWLHTTHALCLTHHSGWNTQWSTQIFPLHITHKSLQHTRNVSDIDEAGSGTMKQQNVKSIFLLSSVSYCRYPSTHHPVQLVIFVGALSEVCPGLLIASYPVCTALTGLLGTHYTIIMHGLAMLACNPHEMSKIQSHTKFSAPLIIIVMNVVTYWKDGIMSAWQHTAIVYHSTRTFSY